MLETAETEGTEEKKNKFYEEVDELLSAHGLYRRHPIIPRSLFCDCHEIREEPEASAGWTKSLARFLGKGELKGAMECSLAVGEILSVLDENYNRVFVGLEDLLIEYGYLFFGTNTPRGFIPGPSHPFSQDLSEYL